MVNEACDLFCCRRWYRQGIISDAWLGFRSCFVRRRFNLHCQVREMYEAVFLVNDYTVIPHEMEPKYWPC